MKQIEKNAIVTNQTPKAIGPYSQGIQMGNMIFVSGQIALSPGKDRLAEGIEAQTKQVFQNIQGVLSEAGLTLDHVVKTTVFLRDINDFAKVNEIYGTYFAKPYPARSAVQVAALPKDGLVEIEVIAMC